MDIAVRDGRIVGVRGRAVDRVNRGRLDPKDLFGWQANNSPDRLTRPLVRREPLVPRVPAVRRLPAVPDPAVPEPPDPDPDPVPDPDPGPLDAGPLEADALEAGAAARPQTLQ